MAGVHERNLHVRRCRCRVQEVPDPAIVEPTDDEAIGGGPAPVWAYLDKLLPDVLAGCIEPCRVFDRNVGLDGVPDGYRAMADREAIKVMVTA